MFCAGIWFTNIENGVADKALLEYVKVENCYDSFHVNNSPVILRGCQSINNHYGLYIIGGGEDVEIQGGIFTLNDFAGIVCNGSNTSPVFLPNSEDYEDDESGYYIHIENNDGYGLYSLGSATPNAAATPIAGAPRTCIFRIAFHISFFVLISTYFLRAGNKVWSRR